MGEAPSRRRIVEVDRGSLGVRPWGRVLADLCRRAFTGTLRIDADKRRFEIGFLKGEIVAASSPISGDATVRIAAKHRLIPTARTEEIGQAIAHAMKRGGRDLIDDVDVVARMGKLTAQQAMWLRSQILVQRAARTFELEKGVFVVTDTPPGDARDHVDVREVVFVGARLFAPQLRLLQELRAFGVHFKLDADATMLLPRFAFRDIDRPVLAALEAGTSLAELDASYRDLDPRTVQAIVYALVACGAARGAQEPWPRKEASGSPGGRLAVGTRDRRPIDAGSAAVESPIKAVGTSKLIPRTRSNTTRQAMFVPQPRTPAPPLARAPTELSGNLDLGRAPTKTATQAATRVVRGANAIQPGADDRADDDAAGE